MLPQKTLSKGGAHAALILNAQAGVLPAARPPRHRDVCMRCGLMRAVHSSIVVIATEVDGDRIVEAPLCGGCTRRMSR